VLRWWKQTGLTRSKRFSVMAVLGVMLWAYLLLFLLPNLHHREIGFVSLMLTAIVVQAASPWKEKSPVRKKKLRLAAA
jgi:hypothetical protein